MFKIQIRSVNGWADLMSSEDDGEYLADLFSSEGEAQKELHSVATSMKEEAEFFRVVDSAVSADDFLYD